MKSFKLEVLSPDRAFYIGDCVSLTLPLHDGLYGVMADHAPLTAAIVPGEVTFTTPGGERIVCAVSQGMVDVDSAGVKLLCETVLRPDEIDEEEARREAEIAAEDIPLQILYEDRDLIFVDKPRGMVVHPAAGHEDGTLVNGLMFHFRDSLSGINGVLRPGIVHRIDKDTSGLLVICKSDAAHLGISRLLETHDIERVYHTVVHGRLPHPEGTIDAPIGRMKADRKKYTVTEDGRRAVTHFRVLEEFGSFSYLEIKLETGRTHQIRVHMASIGHPVLGDPLYGPSRETTSKAKLLEKMDFWPGQILHAKVLGFVHPITGNTMLFDSDLPPYFQTVLHVLRGE